MSACIVFFVLQCCFTLGYTPYGARSIDEYNTYQNFFSAQGLGIAVYIFALAKDGGTMLREPYLKEAINVRALDY